MRTNNPVLSRQFANPYQGQHSQGHGVSGMPRADRPMTYDDVVIKSIIAIAMVVAAAAFSWLFLPPQFFLIAWAASGIITLVLSIMACVRHTVPAWVVMLFALSQGIFVGGFSRMFEMQFPGIVIQAVVGTFVAAFVTLFAYKFFNIRVTPKFRKVVYLSTLSFGVLMLINFVASFFISGGLGFRSGLIGIIAGLVGVTLGVLNLVLDFDHVERGVQAGIPANQAWRAAFGITLTLVWLYLELLRLLSYLRR